MKIAVTGANGFIGRHVVAELSARHLVDLTATSRSDEPTTPLRLQVKYLKFDLAEVQPNTYNLLGRPDVVIHLAWSGLPNYRALRHIEDELPTQYRFLQSLVLSGLPSLLVAGTCFEYGMISGELSESDQISPVTPYGFAKAILHQQLEFLRTVQPYNLTWARLFYLFGNGQSPTSLFPQLEAAIARGDTSFAMSSGEQLRDYLPVEGASRLIAELAIRHPSAGLVNICSGTPVSVRALVEQFVEKKGSRIKLDFGRYPIPDYEPKAFWGSPTKLRSMLGRET